MPRCPRSSPRGTPAPDRPAFLIPPHGPPAVPPTAPAPRASANNAAHSAARGSCAGNRNKRAQGGARGPQGVRRAADATGGRHNETHEAHTVDVTRRPYLAHCRKQLLELPQRHGGVPPTRRPAIGRRTNETSDTSRRRLQGPTCQNAYLQRDAAVQPLQLTLLPPHAAMPVASAVVWRHSCSSPSTAVAVAPCAAQTAREDTSFGSRLPPIFRLPQQRPFAVQPHPAARTVPWTCRNDRVFRGNCRSLSAMSGPSLTSLKQKRRPRVLTRT